MKSTLMIATLLLLPGLLLAQGLGTSAGHDLDALWTQAQKNHDLEVEDAVLLLESHTVTFAADGSRATRVHRVVWIGTAVGVRSYADLRVPWNGATSTLDVEILRTWREGRWWPDAEKISDTAVVHTLPYAVDRADDYTPMRETMLLHDGVELGCIMETAYTITDRDVPGGGGVFVFPQRDPAVLTALTVQAPRVTSEELNGAPGGEILANGGRRWTMELVPALDQPAGAAPELYEPAVVWSTWKDWSEAAEAWVHAFNLASADDEGLVDELTSHLNPAQGSRQKAQAVGTFLQEMVRTVRYDTRHWRFAPRGASRTLATAYGHHLDRAVLASALLEAAGLENEPLLVGEHGALAAPAMARLDEYTRILLVINGLPNTILDPASGKLVGPDATFGQPVWAPVRNKTNPPGATAAGECRVAITLEKADKGWNGEGNFQGEGRFSGYSALLDGEDLAAGFLARLADSVVPGLKTTGAVPGALDPSRCDINFKVEGFEPAEDDHGRRSLVIGAPAGGILSRLPAGVHLHDQHRATPISGLENGHQTVILRLEVDPADLAHVPTPTLVETAAGTFILQVQHEDGWLLITRRLRLDSEPVTAENWPALRTLLLEENDAAHGTMVWKVVD